MGEKYLYYVFLRGRGPKANLEQMKMNKKTTFDVEAVSKKRQLEIQSPVLRSRISGLVGYPRLFQGCEGGPSYWGASL